MAHEHHDTPEELRGEAERRVDTQDSEGRPRATPEDAADALHELRVHQIELEMQNDELRRTQRELDAARARYFDLYELAPVGYLSLDDFGLIVEANVTAATLLRVTKRDLTGKPFSRFVVPEHADLFHKFRLARMADENGNSRSCALQLNLEGSDALWVRLDATNSTDAAGVPAVRVVISDTSELTAANEQLDKNVFELNLSAGRLAAQSRVLQRGESLALIGSWRLVLDTGAVEWSDEMFRIFDVDRESFDGDLGEVTARSIHPDDLAMVERINASVLADGMARPADYRIVLGDGSVRHLHAEGAQEFGENGEVVALVGFVQDVTRQVEAEQAAAESEKRFEVLFEQAPLGYQSLDENGCFREVNSAWMETLGYDRDEIIGTWFGDLLAAPYAEAFRERFPLFKSLGSIHSEFEMLHKDGRTRTIAFDGRIGHNLDGTFKQTHCILADITEQKQATDALRLSEARLRLALEATAQGLYDLDVRTGIAQVTPEYLSMIGEDSTLAQFDLARFGERIHPDDAARVSGITDAYIRGDIDEYRDEFRIRHASGEWVWVLSVGRVVERDQSGQAIRVLGSHTDITQLKWADEALLQDAQAHKAILRAAMDGYWLSDPEGHLLEVNEAYCRMSGYSENELLGIHISELDVLESPDETRRHMLELASLGEATFVSQHRRKDGSVFDVEIGVQYRSDEGGRFVAFSRDITERVEIEERLRESENKYRTLTESISDVIWTLDPESLRFLYVSPSVEKLRGFTPEEVLAEPFDAALTPEGAAAVRGFIGQRTADFVSGVAPSSRSYVEEIEQPCKDGSFVWTEVVTSYHLNPATGMAEVHGVTRDISERKRAALRLAESERGLTESQRVAKLGHCIYDIENDFWDGSPEFYEVLRVRDDQAHDRAGWLESVHPDDRDRLLNYFVNEVLGERQPFDIEYRIAHMAGDDERWVHGLGKVEWAEDGHPVSMFGIIQDITERKHAEMYRDMTREILQVLNEPCSLAESITGAISTLKLRTGFDAVGIRLQEGDDFPYFAQEGFEQEFLKTENSLIGYSETGKPCLDGEGNVELECTCGLVIAGKPDPALTPGGSFWTNDSASLLGLPANEDPRLRPRNECMYRGYASIALLPIRNQGQIVGLIHLNDRRRDMLTLEMVEILEGVAAHVGDALMRKKAEDDLLVAVDELERSNKDLEQFAYVASHDLQEPLRMVSSYTELIRQRYEGKLDDDADEFIGYAVDGAQRMQRLLEDLLDYSRVGTRGKEPAPVDSQAMFDRAVANLDAQVAETGAVVHAGELPRVMADETQLMRVFQNLVGNSIKFQQSGVAPSVEVSAVRSGPNWQFSVTDNGIGIDPEGFDAAFEVFRRLAPRSAYPGTGIGLSVCKRIIMRLGGSIWVESSSSSGTTICFTLPAAPDSTSATIDPSLTES